MPHSSRRRFLAALGAVAAGPWVHAQHQPRIVGYLGFEPLAGSKARLDTFKRALQRLGHAVRYEIRSAEGRVERLRELAKVLVAAKPDLIVSESALTTLPLRQLEASLPIVMAACDDPLATRFVRALDKPGTNATGVALGVREELPGPVEILEMMVAKGATFAGLFNPSSAMYRKARAGLHYGAVKRALGIQYHDATDVAGIDAAFAALRKEKPAGLIVAFDPLFVAERARIVKLAAAMEIPVVYPERSFVEAGGTVSHGPSLLRAFELAAGHAHRILRGENVSNIPVTVAGKHELVVSRRAPAAVVKRADAVL